MRGGHPSTNHVRGAAYKTGRSLTGKKNSSVTRERSPNPNTNPNANPNANPRHNPNPNPNPNPTLNIILTWALTLTLDLIMTPDTASPSDIGEGGFAYKDPTPPTGAAASQCVTPRGVQPFWGS